MTAASYVTGTLVMTKVRHTAVAGSANDILNMAQAVARPSVDRLDSSMCGVLVTALIDSSREVVPDLPKCTECRRVAG